ncbi:hypothetical protein CEXT_456451 [Caerostris extrusa]|uniref:Uncharacterized protein n=1 Tax=Caerostris extrusa TaxID=172846 RepID=A0AAV4UZ07_CAEEX|nr:hypothetical protein CEXT_456451 [Caerostris extrusa]
MHFTDLSIILRDNHFTHLSILLRDMRFTHLSILLRDMLFTRVTMKDVYRKKKTIVGYFCLPGSLIDLKKNLLEIKVMWKLGCRGGSRKR